MARNNFPAALKELLIHEGGYVNHPDDSGGRTNLGVTQRVYEAWVKHPVDEKIMRSLTVDHVRALYKANYWDALKGDDLPSGLDLCVFDRAVCEGVRMAAVALQHIVGAETDGIVGGETLEAVRDYARKPGVAALVDAYQTSRQDTPPKRVEAVRKAAKAMAYVGVAA